MKIIFGLSGLNAAELHGSLNQLQVCFINQNSIFEGKKKKKFLI